MSHLPHFLSTLCIFVRSSHLLCYFSHCCKNILNKDKLRRKGFSDAHSLREHTTLVENACPLKCEATIQFVCAIRNQRAVKVGTSSAYFSCLFSSLLGTRSWYGAIHIQDKYSQLNISEIKHTRHSEKYPT